MVAVLQAIATTSGGGSSAPARNHRGEANAVPAAVTTTLVSFTADDFKLRGFVAFGTTDFIAWVEVSGVPLDGIVARSNVAKFAQVVLPNPESYNSPLAIVALRIRNENPFSQSGDFEGTLLGE